MASATPKHGGDLSVAGVFASTSPPGLDPILVSDARTGNHCVQVYGGLWKDKIASGLSAWDWLLEPDLAMSVEVVDSLTRVYRLRQGVAWQNLPPLNGRPFTAEDVAWTWKAYAAEPKSSRSAEFRNAKSIQVIDQETLKVIHGEPDALWESRVTCGTSFILPHEIADADGNFMTRSVGTGPFILDQNTENVGAIYRRNPNYYDKTRPYVDSLKVPVIADQARIQASLIAGDSDVWTGVAEQSQVDATLSANKNLRHFQYAEAPMLLAFRCDKKPFDDVRVRQAMMLTIDFAGLVKRFGGPKGDVQATISSDWTQWALPRDGWGTGKKYHSEANITEAKALLSAAGHANGIDSDLNINAAYSTRVHGAMAPVLQQMAQEAGIRFTLKQIPSAQYPAVLQGPGDYNGVVLIGVVRYQDPDQLLSAYIIPHSPSRWISHNEDAQLEKLIKDQRIELDLTKRKALINEADKLNLVQNYVAPLITLTQTDMTSARVGGYSPRPSVVANWAQGIWLG